MGISLNYEGRSDLIDKSYNDDAMRIFSLVTTYLEIVMNTAKDILPKMIVSMILNETKRFIKEDFFISIQKECKSNPNLIAENPESAQNRREVLERKELLTNAVDLVAKMNIIASGGTIEIEK